MSLQTERLTASGRPTKDESVYQVWASINGTESWQANPWVRIEVTQMRKRPELRAPALMQGYRQ